jgi:hypothetical protein
MNGLTGRESSGGFATSFVGGRGTFGRVDTGCDVSRVKTAGRSNSRLNNHVDDEYTVVAPRVAPQFRMKSTKVAIGVYGVKVRLRD